MLSTTNCVALKKKVSPGEKNVARSRGYIVVICGVVLRGQMTTGKTGEASGFGV
jgi:hypothetical protein